MRYFIYLFLLIYSMSIAQSAKKNEHIKKGNAVVLNKTDIRLENGFLRLKEEKSNKESSYFEVFGERVTIKITNENRYLIKSSQIYNYRPLVNIENIEIQVLKNNKIDKNWTLVTETKRYKENKYSSLTKKGFIENGYIPYTDSLIDGDKVVVLFRKKGKEIFLKLDLEKKESARKPFVIMTINADLKKEISFEKFVQETTDELRENKYLDTDKSNNLYKDWPDGYSSRVIGNTNRHFKNEKYCLIFRKPNGKKRTYDSFEYRTSINSKTGEWINSNGIIFLNLKDPGTEYTLEVRYKDDSKHVEVYKCYTEPEWYQTIWFKITCGVILLLIFSVFYIFWMKKQNDRKRLEEKSKLKMLSAQLNPHFVFNALGSIQGLLNDNQIEKANQYLVGFSSLLRNTLASSENEIHSVENELKSINNYVELEQLRNPFKYNFSIDENINIYETEIIPLLIQPLIENAIKHGISNKANAELTISISKNEDDLIFEITDNGKGFDILAEQKGFGLKLVKDRISLFNQSSKKKKIELDIQSNTSGTKSTVCYKNWLKND